MFKVKKIEIIINSLEVERVTKIIDETGIGGYTIIKDAQGKGVSGYMNADELTDVFKNSYIMTACSEEKATILLEKLRPVLHHSGGAALVSDAMWILPKKKNS
ncbi:MAG: P-II family nitrogen regulator [Bacteroidia bacterium]